MARIIAPPRLEAKSAGNVASVPRLKAVLLSKCKKPSTRIQALSPSTPSQTKIVSLPSVVMRRYKRKMTNAPMARTAKRAAGAGHHGSEFAPDQPVENDEQAGADPAEQRVGAGKLAKHEWYGGKDAGADDHANVQGRRMQQAKMAVQARGFRRLVLAAH